MSKFFSFKLFREGMKKSLLVGVAIVAIVTAITALVPLSELFTVRYYEPGYEPTVRIITTQDFAIPLLLILPLAPVLTLSMFSYLNKRNESDFYHSIPFTRPCVYFSFVASVMAWLTAAIALSILVTSILWLFVPYTTYSITTPLLLFGAYFLSTLLLTAFTVVAMSITGTPISNLLIFVLLFAFVRVGGGLFIACLESRFPLMEVELTPARFLQADFSMPIALVLYPLTGNQTTLFSNIPLWIYTAVISVLLLAVGCILYSKRHSEMAGQSAPSPILQHIYRCAITLPMAFVLAYYLIEEGLDEGVLTLLVITLLVYYLYEILTTKRLKNCLKATAFLPILVAGGLLFGGGVLLAENVAVNYSPDADELKSVSFYVEEYSGRQNYEDLLTASVEITDPEALKLVADELADMKKIVKEHGYRYYRNPDLLTQKDPYLSSQYKGAIEMSDTYWGLEYQPISYSMVELKITEKSGRVCGRTLVFTEEEYLNLIKLFNQSEEYQEAYLSLPSESEVLEVYGGQLYSADESTRRAVWDSFVREYNTLSRETKIEYKSLEPYSYNSTIIEVAGTLGISDFYRSYPLLPEYFPETTRLYIDVANEISLSSYTTIRKNLSEQMTTTYNYLTLFADENNYQIAYDPTRMIEILDFADACVAPVDGSGIITRLSLETDFGYAERYYLLSERDLQTLCQMFMEQETKQP